MQMIAPLQRVAATPIGIEPRTSRYQDTQEVTGGVEQAIQIVCRW